MAAKSRRSTTRTTIACPGHICGGKCGGEWLNAYGLADLNSATIEIDRCSALASQGWGDGVQEVLWQSQGHLLQPLPAAGQPVRHRDGLVIFNG